MSFLTDPIAAFADWITHPMPKRVFSFNEGTKTDAHNLSIKGANLCIMSKNKLIKTPPGFVISSAACMEYQQKGELTTSLLNEIENGIHGIESASGKVYGPSSILQSPLLLLVRGGALVPLPSSNNPYYIQSYESPSESQSIPGLNKSLIVGFNAIAVDALSVIHNRKTALRSYSQFLFAFGTIIYGKPIEQYNQVYDKYRLYGYHPTSQANWTENEYEGIITDFRNIQDVPDDVHLQLRLVILHLYYQWYSDKAIKYRELIGFPLALGTCIIVQMYMIGDAGFMRTRSITTFGDIQKMDGWIIKSNTNIQVSLYELCNQNVYISQQLQTLKREVEYIFQDAQDIEFTIDENDVVYVLQSRIAHRSPREMIRIAIAMVSEGIITPRKAMMIIDPIKLEYYIRDHVEPQDMKLAEDHVVIAHGTPSSSNGSVSGQIYFTLEDFLAADNECNKIYICTDCTECDVPAIKQAIAIINTNGNHDSETSILCRGLGKPCLIQTWPIIFILDENNKHIGCTCGKYSLYTGDELYIDSEKGEIYVGFHHPVLSGMDLELQRILRWADDCRRCRIHGAADSCAEARYSINNAADGIFLDLQPNTSEMLQYLVTTNENEKQIHLKSIINSLRVQYQTVIRLLHRKTIRVRLFDYNMRNFLPYSDTDAAILAETLNLNVVNIKLTMKICKEHCISGRGNGMNNILLYESLIIAQLTALIEALHGAHNEGVKVHCEIAISDVNNAKDSKILSNLLTHVMTSNMDRTHQSLLLQMGISLIISTPLQCLQTYALIQENNTITSIYFDVKKLTENCMGLTSEDLEKAVQTRIIKGLLQESPLNFIDENGVGKLMCMCIDSCRNSNPLIKIGADVYSNVNTRCLYYVHSLKLDYVSCDPFKLPIARVICAQACVDEYSIEKTFELKSSVQQTSDENKMDTDYEDDWHVFF